MTHFHYQNQQLYVEDTPLASLAQAYGTPLFVYSAHALKSNFSAFTQALQPLPHLICYAVKANSNIGILNYLAKLGAGFDIVSIGELHRVLAAGGQANKIVFSGVGKTESEIKNALELGIQCFNIESAPELMRIHQIAKAMRKTAPIAIRVNPDVEADTHPYISTGLKTHKFGVDTQTAIQLYQQAQSLDFIEIKGIDCHIGSQLTALEPFMNALEHVLALIQQLKDLGIDLHHVNFGGGLGVRYQDENPPSISDFCNALATRLKGQGLSLILEPGRAICANAGLLLTQIEYIKDSGEKHFAIVDAAMNDLLRPSLYNAWHEINPVTQHPDVPVQDYDVVGPICETGDFFARTRGLKIKDRDHLAIMNAGAYAFTMSSNYNSRPRAAEVLVEGDAVHLIRSRETYKDLFLHEHLLPSLAYAD